MTRYHNLLIALVTILLLGGALTMIGWIGWEEHLRLAVKNLAHTVSPSPATNSPTATNTPLPNINSKEEAQKTMQQLEEGLRTLEEDALPQE